MFVNKFGIEIEFLGMGSYTDFIATQLDTPGSVTVFDAENGTFDDEPLAWYVKGDSSVQDVDGAREGCPYCYDDIDNDDLEPCMDCDSCAEFMGAEIVSSPMLFDTESKYSIEQLCYQLNKHKAYTNETCGLHVHVDASFVEDMTQAQAQRFFEHIRTLYAKHEDIFDSRVIRGRQKDRNTYCRTMKYALAAKEDRCINYDLSRYVKLNTCSYVQHGTIEFRQYHGTTDANEIIEWVKTCLLFVNYARESFEATERAAWETEMRA